MLCQRCSGLLVRETLSDLKDETALPCSATHFINCVSIEDSVVRANQSRSPREIRSAPRDLHRRGVVFIQTHSEECGAI